MRAQFTIELIASYAYLWPYPVGAVALFMFLRMRNSLRGRISALQGAAWELVRRMENTTPDGVRERARVAESTTEKFAVDGNAKIPRSAMFSGDAATSDLTAAGLALMERHANEAAQFRAERSALRAGIAIFLSLMVYRNSQSAFIAMTEYMRRQRERTDIPNFADLKMVLGLPSDWPAEWHRRKSGLTRWDYFAIRFTVRRRSRVLSGL